MLMLVLLVLSEKKILPVGWSWLVIWGTVLTFAGGLLLAPLLDQGIPAGSDRRE